MIDQLSVIIPALNEEESLPFLLDELYENLDKTGISYEILIIDDGSKLSVSSIVEENKNLKIYRNKFTKGQSQALLLGIKNSNYEYIAILDADGQNPPYEIINLLNAFNESEGKYDVIAGYRKDRKDKFFRSLYSKIGNFLIKLLLNSKIKDLGCSLKLFRKEIMQDINFTGDIHRVILTLFEYRSYKIKQIPVDHKERVYGETKYGLGRLIPVIVDTFIIYLTEGFTKTARYSLGKLGIYFGSLSILLFIFSLLQKYIQSIFVHKNPIFLIGMIFLFLSIQLFVTSIITFFTENKSS
tara:strand:+ start:252 stop:1145 length:894 start_codon:yes stop_codon:yes gene_type:complete